MSVHSCRVLKPHHAGRQRDGGGQGRVRIAPVVGLHLQRAHGDQQPAPARARPPQEPCVIAQCTTLRLTPLRVQNPIAPQKEPLASLSHVTEVARHNHQLIGRRVAFQRGCAASAWRSSAVTLHHAALAAAMPGARTRARTRCGSRRRRCCGADAARAARGAGRRSRGSWRGSRACCSPGTLREADCLLTRHTMRIPVCLEPSRQGCLRRRPQRQ